MQLINVDVPLDFNLFLLGDQHIGARLFDSDGWDTAVEMVLSPYDGCKNNYVVHHVDAIEGILIDDTRYGFNETIESRTLDQMQMWQRSIEPIKKQTICLLTGNHELKLQRFGDVSAKMAALPGIYRGRRNQTESQHAATAKAIIATQARPMPANVKGALSQATGCTSKQRAVLI